MVKWRWGLKEGLQSNREKSKDKKDKDEGERFENGSKES